MMTQQEAMAKASKLLKLSESSNANEAALAAGMAQRILSKYKIDAAMLDIDGNGPAEAIHEGETLEDGGGKLASWKGMLAHRIANVNACRVFQRGSSICIVGRDSDIAKVRYFYAFLSLEIDRLCKLLSKGMGRSYATSFRLGAVQAIGEKLLEAKRNAEKDAAEAVSAENTAGLVLLNKALQKMINDDAAVEAWMRAKYQLGSKKTSYSGSSEGRAAGYRAGQSVNINGGSKAVGAGRRMLNS